MRREMEVESRCDYAHIASIVMFLGLAWACAKLCSKWIHASRATAPRTITMAAWGRWQDLKFWRAHPWIDASMGSNGINWWWRGVRKEFRGDSISVPNLPNASSTYAFSPYTLEHHNFVHFASIGNKLHVPPCHAHAATGSPSSSSLGAQCCLWWPH